jgi:hypothetical protein
MTPTTTNNNNKYNNNNNNRRGNFPYHGWSVVRYSKEFN